MTVWTLAFPAQVYSGGLPSDPVMVNVLIEAGSPKEAARDFGDALRALVKQAQVPSRTEIKTSPPSPEPTCGDCEHLTERHAGKGRCRERRREQYGADTAMGESYVLRGETQPVSTAYRLGSDESCSHFKRAAPSYEPTCGDCTKGQWKWLSRSPAEKERNIAWCDPQSEYRHVRDKVAQAGADGKRCPYFYAYPVDTQ